MFPAWGEGVAAGVAIAALWIAMAVDMLFGEPPARLHPVVWIGRYLGWAGRLAAPTSDAVAPKRDLKHFMAGALFWLAGAAIVFGVAWAWQSLALQAPALFAALLLGLVLKPMLAWRMLRVEVLAVEAALAESLDAGRARLRHLVSRDVTQLDAAAVRESAIESLAENLNDSVVAPIFWFVLCGLPGAAVYRFANTADAMWGYRGERGGRVWEWAGKWAARADDVLSWLPARFAGVLMLLLAGRPPWRGLRTEAAHTPSPNSGWPMAAMALALGVRLGKPGVYALNAGGRAPGSADTLRAVALCRRVVLAYVLLSSAAMILMLPTTT
ncbi:cobalamin biosynthesis protein CobD [Rhodoferax koreense]|uniref:Cobalamin biosynthesis protein CobD n=1 Tax=Rhodoferax koreensis TaxID=1842727 RepID=A0A1P8JVD2_9BURK|nr:adenosylcobinamide-phosphate synthase CbiB [Rhodoferax koreense]APW37704.1 cobalamin biosynthesis protein CobD [Rhodoferax koreense]